MSALYEKNKKSQIKYEATTERYTIRLRKRNEKEMKAIQIMEQLRAEGKNPKDILVDLLLNNYCNNYTTSV